MNIHKYLRERAKSLRVGESGLLCLDWHNGNRSILTDVSLTGALFGMTLQTRPEEIYRAFIEGTVFGARRIFENFEENGIAIEQVTASGGIAEKDEMFVQICADVLNRSILVTDADMAASRGSAICAAVAAGLYPDLTTASKALGVHTGVTYTPVPENVKAYDKLYAEYKRLHDYFGCGENNVLKNLRGLCD